MHAVDVGDRVTIHYTGMFEDGTVFDTSRGREPFSFTAGSDEVIPGLSKAVLGMQPGEAKRIVVPPEEGYGERQPGLERQVPRDLMPADVQEGDPVRANFGEGRSLVLWVVRLEDDIATLDANHPLAGKTLHFDIEVVSVEPAEKS